MYYFVLVTLISAKIFFCIFYCFSQAFLLYIIFLYFFYILVSVRFCKLMVILHLLFRLEKVYKNVRNFKLSILSFLHKRDVIYFFPFPDLQWTKKLIIYERKKKEYVIVVKVVKEIFRLYILRYKEFVAAFLQFETSPQ